MFRFKNPEGQVDWCIQSMQEYNFDSENRAGTSYRPFEEIKVKSVALSIITVVGEECSAEEIPENQVEDRIEENSGLKES